MQKKFETRYGYFTEDGTEFVITDYRTPRPWVNVISNGSYGLVVSQLNGGFSWIEHSNINRLTRWQQDLIRDNWGKYIYLRDEENGDFWSPTIQPVMKELDSYQCRHGIGYTYFFSAYKGIETKIRIFVPFRNNLEIWTIQIKNTEKKQRRLSLFTYLEWCLGVGPDNHREFHKAFLETEFNSDNQVLLARKRLWEIPSSKGHWNTEWNSNAYFACSEPIDGFDSDKEAFIGKYRDLSNPLSLETGQLTGKEGKWNDSIGSLKKNVNLEPDAQKTINFFLGAEDDPERIFALLKKYRNPQTVETAFREMKQKWNSYLTKTTVQTPDQALNFMTNTWLKYQSISCRLWGRAAYYQQSGAFGFRDQLQDSQIFLYIEPELTKKQILLHAKHQFKNGSVLHWWHPITDQGHNGNMSDDLLWLPFITVQYLKETADWQILEEKLPFYDDNAHTDLLHHCLLAIDCVLNRFSARGLPLILSGDWNDGLSAMGLEGKGESIWLAHFVYYILDEIIPILEHRNLSEKKDYYQQRASELKNTINEIGWDGNWFWRASKDNGELIGSHNNDGGKIYLNAQIWAVIAKSTDSQRQKKILQQVETLLESDVGPILFHPGYMTPDSDIGYLSRYAPGVRENGGVYTHAATWSIWAECLLKHSQQAYRIYRKINPIYNGLNPDRYFAEPYVTPGNIDGPASPNYGRGGWSWYTGSAAWLFRITIDHLIGIEADYDGLIVKPCFPKEWTEVNVKRLFRGKTYHIKIINVENESDIPIEIWIKDKKMPGNKIPVVTDQEEIQVVVKRNIRQV
ncbi:glycosyl transferase family 36 [candidate division KSB1 bacterium]|nr:glycosyl transferase family 36 [candidate division KSB1 bacterium]